MQIQFLLLFRIQLHFVTIWSEEELAPRNRIKEDLQLNLLSPSLLLIIIAGGWPPSPCTIIYSPSSQTFGVSAF